MMYTYKSFALEETVMVISIKIIRKELGKIIDIECILAAKVRFLN